ncbi:PilZ domain-containing protein [Acidithiobacillus albertensis]|uniref:PilZ domain-containing protein n=1 Tax=Acidithiobacillus albertensis TaxID=119978 RepID=UPI001C074089|nr:PilZ domain-containing protein [Acidithiobacillus albertensis]MBU2743383.1 PilZ domain-containing protein [Acidithiobacillus albertensis]
MAQYLALTLPQDADDYLLPSPEGLNLQSGHSALIYRSDEHDNGTLCHVRGWDADDLMLEQNTLSLDTSLSYKKTLIFILARPYLMGFFADWKCFQSGTHYFQRPQRVLRRKSRMHARVPIHGKVLVHRRSGDVTSHILNDFSPGGASFYSEDKVLSQGEMLLIEMEINACGVCETTASIARIESLEHSAQGYLVGVRFNLSSKFFLFDVP